ncbi:MAG: hypothetical protein ACR2GK_09495 [Gemmatimonadaceae bacterium]
MRLPAVTTVWFVTRAPVSTSITVMPVIASGGGAGSAARPLGAAQAVAEKASDSPYRIRVWWHMGNMDGGRGMPG